MLINIASSYLNRAFVALLCAGIAALLMGCSSLQVGEVPEVKYGTQNRGDVDTGGGLLDGLGIPLVGGGPGKGWSGGGGSAGIGVNARAAIHWRNGNHTRHVSPSTKPKAQ